jgi:hypothetical protein
MQTERAWTLDEVKADWARVKCEVAWVRMLFAARDYRLAPARKHVANRRQAARLMARKYSPDQPRVPGGQSGGGQWTDGGGGAGQPIEEVLRNPELAALLQNVAYPGDFHDLVRDYLVKGLRAGGSIVETEVSLVLPGPPPIEARIDILARNPTGLLYGIDVKTGENPTFTPQQMIVYPHAIGGAGVLSFDAKILSLGLTPGRPLPAFAIDAVYTRGYGQPMDVKPLPAEPK